jgi:hypothetical protein
LPAFLTNYTSGEEGKGAKDCEPNNDEYARHGAVVTEEAENLQI